MRRDEGRLAHGLEILCYEWERTRARDSCSGDAAPVHPTQAPAFQRWEGGGARATRRRPAPPFARRCASGTGPTPSPLESRRLLGLGWTPGRNPPSLGPVWLPTSALSQALRVQEQMFVWFACLSDLAPRVQDSPRSQALQKRRNRPYLPGLSHLVQVSLNPCTVREIEIHGRDEPNNSCYWPG